MTVWGPRGCSALHVLSCSSGKWSVGGKRLPPPQPRLRYADESTLPRWGGYTLVERDLTPEFAAVSTSGSSSLRQQLAMARRYLDDDDRGSLGGGFRPTHLPFKGDSEAF